MTFVSLAASLAALGGIYGIIWTLSDRADKTLRAEAKQALVRWLKTLSLSSAISQAPSAFTETFDAVFGSRVVSLRFLVRSVVLSLAVLLVALLVWLALSYDNLLQSVQQYNPEPGHARGSFDDLMHVSARESVVYGLAWAFSINLVVDYISLAKSRRLMSIMQRKPSVSSLAKYYGADLVATVALYAAFVSFFSPMVWIFANEGRFGFSFEGESFGSLDWLVGGFEEMESAITLYAPDTWEGSFPQVPQAVFLYSSLFSLGWSSVFFLSHIAARFFVRTERHWTKLRDRWLDVDSKPLQALAVLSMIAATVVYVAYMAAQVALGR